MKMKKGDWHGRYVKLLVPLNTKGGAMFKEGEIMLVTRNFGGLYLEKITNCKECHCQFRTSINKIPERHVILMEKDFKPEQ